MMKMLQDDKSNRFEDMTLHKTYKSDDIKTKNNQVATNLIDNAIVGVQNELREIVDNTIEKEIPFLDNLIDDPNEYVTCRVHLKTSTVKRLNKFAYEKYEQGKRSSIEIDLMLIENLDKIDAIKHKDAFQYIKYDNSTPRIDTLEKLLEIIKQLRENNTNVFSESEILQVIKKQNIRDPRTIKKYQKCVRMYSINRNQMSIALGQVNISGFYEGVITLIKKREDAQNIRKSNDYHESFTEKGQVRGTGVAPTIQNAVNEANMQNKAMHDFRIRYPSKKIFQNAVKMGIEPHPKNKGIFENAIHVTEEITTNVAIYPKKVDITLGCTQNPIPYNATGAKQLLDHIVLINNLLSETYHTNDNPDPLEWIVFYYHLNQDGTTKLSKEKLYRTITNSSGEKTTDYTKDFDNGTKRMRSELTITNKIPLGELLEDMEKYA